MLHVPCYGTRLAEERKKMNNSDFRSLQVCHFKIVTITTADWGRLYKLLCTFRCEHFVLWQCVNANTLIGAAILKSGHPYIMGSLLQAHRILKVRQSSWLTWHVS